MNVAILLLEDAYCSSVSGLIDIFQIANHHLLATASSTNPQINWSLVSSRLGKSVQLRGGLHLISNCPVKELAKFDVIFLPALYYPGYRKLDEWLLSYRWITPYIMNAYSNGVLIAANCTSTFLLAEAKLLNGKKATTTWWLETVFRKRYREVNLEPHMAIVEDSNVLSSGSMTAYNQLAIRLIDKFYSHEIATLTANTMLISSSSSQAIHLDTNINFPICGDDLLVTKAQYWLQNHIQSSVDFAKLSAELKVSQRTLIRRFKLSLGVTPLVYLQELRLELVKNLLLNSHLRIEHIMHKAGYADMSAFFRFFKKRVGMSPQAFRIKYSLDK